MLVNLSGDLHFNWFSPVVIITWNTAKKKIIENHECWHEIAIYSHTTESRTSLLWETRNTNCSWEKYYWNNEENNWWHCSFCSHSKRAPAKGNKNLLIKKPSELPVPKRAIMCPYYVLNFPVLIFYVIVWFSAMLHSPRCGYDLIQLLAVVCQESPVRR